MVKAHFKEASTLFVVDHRIKGILRMLNYLVMSVSRIRPILGKVAGAVNVAFVSAALRIWSLKAALLEPLAVTAMVDVYFKTINGQTPNPEWDEKLSSASDKFRELSQKATSYVSDSFSAAGTTPSATLM